MPEVKEEKQEILLSVEEFLSLPENNFTDREKFSISVSYKYRKLTIENWKKLSKNGN